MKIFPEFVFFLITLMSLSSAIYAQKNINDPTLGVWANEAIVATYSFDDKNFIEQQRQIAQYFTAAAWIGYSRAFQASKIPKIVKENHYSVSAVSLLPPVISNVSPQHWQAVMPLLVLYKNLHYQQKQTLNVTLDFMKAPAGQGVRGFLVTLFKSKIASPPCRCDVQNIKSN